MKTIHTYLGYVSALLALFSCSINAANLKPVVLEPTYQHDKWNTEPDDHIRQFRAFTASFDGDDDGNADGDAHDDQDKWGVPEWVAYEIRAASPGLGAAPGRPSTWIHDSALFAAGVCPDDESYKHSGYSRGHMCMKSIAWRLGANADWNTHTTINACPQLQGHNGGIWLNLEELTKDWANTYGTIWVICGPIFEGKVPTKWIGDNDEKKVAIPDAFFKIIIRETDNENDLKTMAFIQPHKKISKVGGQYQHADYLRSIDEIEEATGLDFLTGLDDPLEDSIEAATATALWSTETPEANDEDRDEPEVVDVLTDDALVKAIADLKGVIESVDSVARAVALTGEDGQDHVASLKGAEKAAQEAHDYLVAFGREEPASEETGTEGLLLRIVSILPNPVGDDNIGEAVTIRNDANAAVDLSRYRLEDDDNTSWSLKGILQPGATAVFLAKDNDGTMKLANGGDTVNLVQKSDGRTIHTVRYGRARSGETFSF